MITTTYLYCGGSGGDRVIATTYLYCGGGGGGPVAGTQFAVAAVAMTMKNVAVISAA